MTSISLEESANTRFLASFRQLCEKSDCILAIGLGVQWVILVGLALVVTPKTWIGSTSSPNTHLIAAIVMGGIVAALPMVLMRFQKGELSTRLSIGIA